MKLIVRSLVFAVATAVACGGSSSDPEQAQVASAGAGTDEGGRGGRSVEERGTINLGGTGGNGSSRCSMGQACEGGGICVADGSCCEALRSCGDVCCDVGQVCTFGACVTPGSTCETVDDCGDREVCDFSLFAEPASGGAAGAAGGPAIDACSAELRIGTCMPRPPVCAGEPTSGAAGAASVGGAPGAAGASGSEVFGDVCVEACEVRRTGNLQPEVRFEADGRAYTAPIVLQLDDDDCDNRITERDIPAIAWVSIAGTYTDNQNGTLNVYEVEAGELQKRWDYGPVLPVGQIAGGDVDGAVGNEIVVCGADLKVRMLRGDGSVGWTSQANTCGITYPNDGFPISVPNIADLDGDGTPEVITERAIIDGKSGVIEHRFSTPALGPVTVADLDGDGTPEIVSGRQVFGPTGLLLADTGQAGAFWPAIGDLDGDGQPEIVSVAFSNQTTTVWRYKPGPAPRHEVVRSGIPNRDPNVATSVCNGQAGAARGGGPPTIGDFNGDGTADIGLAAGAAYVVFDGKKVMDGVTAKNALVLWGQPTNDCSSAQTGSTLFDFDGNGTTEVVYGDQEFVFIYDGATGQELGKICNKTGTINEYPVVADVDGDGQADILAMSSTGGCEGQVHPGGMRVLGSRDNSWVRTRRVWNQYTYHVTNVNEDGTIPRQELMNWTQPGLNNFRQNKQPGLEWAAPDATLTLLPECSRPFIWRILVQNRGEAPLPAGVKVTLTEDGDRVIGERVTSSVLYPGQTETLAVELTNPSVGKVKASLTTTAEQCRTDNDETPEVLGGCAPIQ